MAARAKQAGTRDAQEVKSYDNCQLRDDRVRGRQWTELAAGFSVQQLI